MLNANPTSEPCIQKTEIDGAATRKEVFDYLRNKQKSAEIESKVNGINVWTLLGAIAVISWQFIDVFDVKWWSRPEFTLRLCLATQASFLLINFGSLATKNHDEIRFRQAWSDLESPFLWFLSSALFLAPSAIFTSIFGYGFAGIVLLLFGFVFITGVLIEFAVGLIRVGPGERRFPKAQLKPPRIFSKWMGLTLSSLLLYSVIEQVYLIFKLVSVLEVNLLKNALLAVVLYWLASTLLRRKLQGENIDWTYSLETDLALGLISPVVALRRIEHRYLGPRLSAVMDEFFDDLDKKLEGLALAVESFQKESESIKAIPVEFEAERLARLNNSSYPARNQIEELMRDHEDYLAFSDKLVSPQVRLWQPNLVKTLRNMNIRHKQYFERTKHLKSKLSATMKVIEASGDSGALI